MKEKITILITLVKRDYALQFAGSALGIFWSFIQSISIILIYSIVFFFLNNPKNLQEHLIYLFSGLIFWLPIQDMLIRSVSILAENRNLIKKSNLGIELFLLIPLVQMFIQFLIISIPSFIIFSYYEKLNYFTFLFSYLLIILTGFLIFLISSYLARINILLKDISPLIRLFTQFLFWSLPILYSSNGILVKINILNPFLILLELFRFFTYGELVKHNLLLLIYPIGFSLIIYCLAKKRIFNTIWDHL